MSSARGQYRRASLEDDDLIDPDDGKHCVQAVRCRIPEREANAMNQRISTISMTL